MNLSFKKSDTNKSKKTFYRMKILELLDLKNTTVKIGSKGKRHYSVISNCPKDIRKCLVSKIPDKPFLL